MAATISGRSLSKIILATTIAGGAGFAIGHDAKPRLDARLFAMGSMAFSEIAAEHKTRHFSTLSSAKRPGSNELLVAELGVGVGTNFAQYPPGTVILAAVDPNPHYESLFRRNIAGHPGVSCDKYLIAKAENLSMIPSGSVDVVVTTLVLCQREDDDKFFSEILRILRPGGRYYFFEHVDAYMRTKDADAGKVFFRSTKAHSHPKATFGSACQHFSKIISGWYEKRRSTQYKEYRGSGEEDLIREAGFEKVELEVFHLPTIGDAHRTDLSWYARRMAASMAPTLHIAGYATKRGPSSTTSISDDVGRGGEEQQSTTKQEESKIQRVSKIAADTSQRLADGAEMAIGEAFMEDDHSGLFFIITDLFCPG